MSDEPRLLVVDDEDAICEGCQRVFSRQGFDVCKCSDATEGLNLATKSDYSAILLDIKMPDMDGIQFLEALRKEKPHVPVVLMTGYPSIPNAASAIRLGASDYVTKPFTPEEISQAVHRLLSETESPVASVMAPTSEAAGTKRELRFWHDAWYHAGSDGAAHVGGLVVRPGAAAIESVQLPKLGEVVYQGLPLAAVTVAGQRPRIVPSPLSGVVVAVNESLLATPSLLLTDPCGQGWIACVSPTRLDEEAANCSERRVVLLSSDGRSAEQQVATLAWLGCDVRTVATLEELASARKSFDAQVVLVDGEALGSEGPAIVGAINAQLPSVKIVVLASHDNMFEAAYRIRRIFYYAVEPFSDNEMADILTAAFRPAGTAALRAREFAQALGAISITNHHSTRVRLVPAPGLLRRESGLGELTRHKLMQRRFPIESSPAEIEITPLNLLSAVGKCDRLIVLVAQDTGRLPGSLLRDVKAEFVALSGKGADRVTTFIVQPTGSEIDALNFDAATIDALADQLVREMASVLRSNNIPYTMATQIDTTEIEQIAETNVGDCYQCGKCSAGCPMAERMDVLPNQLVRLVQLGRPDRALCSEAIWKCVSCMTCSTRCPKSVDCAGVIDELRQLAVARGVVSEHCRRTVLFQQAFLENIRRNGRLRELELVGAFKTKAFLADRNISLLLKDALLGPKMMARAKLHLRGKRVTDRALVRRIFERCRVMSLQKGSCATVRHDMTKTTDADFLTPAVS